MGLSWDWEAFKPCMSQIAYILKVNAKLEPKHIVQVFCLPCDRFESHISKRSNILYVPANTKHWTNVVSMLGRRLRRRPNIEPTVVHCLVFSGIRYRRYSTGQEGFKSLFTTWMGEQSLSLHRANASLFVQLVIYCSHTVVCNVIDLIWPVTTGSDGQVIV